MSDTLEEQNETINDPLDVIGADDRTNEFQNIFENSNIKFDVNIALKQSI